MQFIDTGPERPPTPARDRFGLCQWFHYEDHRLVEATVEALEDLGVAHLRTGISWADSHRPGGPAWNDWQMETLGHADLEVLLCLWHTPPSLTEEQELRRSSLPPRRPGDFADFVEETVDRHGDGFQHLELWNEPNNPYKWDPAYDPGYERFAEMIVLAAERTRACGKTPVLGGLTLLDYGFVATMDRLGVLEELDIVGIHAFPGMWKPFASSWDVAEHWYGWEHRIGEIRGAAGGREVWVTETGLATWDDSTGQVDRYELQARRLEEALEAPAPRVYWYTLFDLPADRVAIEEANQGPREEAEYHMGLVRTSPGFALDGHRKPAYHALRDCLRPSARGGGAVSEPGPG